MIQRPHHVLNFLVILLHITLVLVNSETTVIPVSEARYFREDLYKVTPPPAQ